MLVIKKINSEGLEFLRAIPALSFNICEKLAHERAYFIYACI